MAGKLPKPLALEPWPLFGSPSHSILVQWESGKPETIAAQCCCEAELKVWLEVYRKLKPHSLRVEKLEVNHA